jgi:hypothetical protein
MNSFREFYAKSSQPEVPPVKWNVVLFTGEYNPICKDEYHRVMDFVQNFVKLNPDRFDNNADIGLLTPEVSLNGITTKMRCDLTFEERQFLSGKFFGFKMFPIDFNQLMALSHFNKDETLSEQVEGISKFFKEQFDGSNILIVLRNSDGSSETDLKNISHTFTEHNINIGFIKYEHAPIDTDDYFKKIPCNGKMLKACCLLDAERPDALSLKAFAHKYNIQDQLEQIKAMHFITRNERYDLIFKHRFPDIILHERSNEEQDYNVRTVMEIVKKMYTSKND